MYIAYEIIDFIKCYVVESNGLRKYLEELYSERVVWGVLIP